MTTAIYIGAGTDTRPINSLPNITTFYYIDSLPKSPHGNLHYGEEDWYRKNFISTLDKNMKTIGMEVVDTKDDLRIYRNGNRKIYYYTNVAMPEHYDKIKSIEFDTLIVAGHDPHKCIMNNKTDIKFIGFDGTYYGTNQCAMNDEQEHENQLVYKLHIDENIRKQFNYFEYYHTKLYKIGKFTSFSLFLNYVNMFEKN